MARRPGRPAFQPSEEQRRIVEVMVGFGIPEAEICGLIRKANGKPIDGKTLRKRFREEIATGAAKIKLTVGQFMVASILGRDAEPGIVPLRDERARASLAQLFARSRMGWRETVVNQHEGKERGAPIIFKTIGPDADI
jgi:hypothetical protein